MGSMVSCQVPPPKVPWKDGCRTAGTTGHGWPRMATDGDGHRASDRTCCQDFVEVIIINYPFSRYSSEFLTSGTEAWQHPGDSLRYHVSICLVVLGGSWWFYEKISWDQKHSQFHKPPRKEHPISLIQWWRRVSELHSSIFGRCMEINHPILQCQEWKSLCGEICILHTHTLYLRVSVMICGHVYIYNIYICM